MEADYTDTYTTVLRNTSRMTAKDLFRMMFVYYPKPVQYLLRFRDWQSLFLFYSSFSYFDLQMASETGGTNLGEREH